MEIRGRLLELFDTQQVTDTFRKREFVIEYAENSNYPETLLFQAVQDRCDMLNGLQLNDTVVVSFDLKGRKWVSPKGETKYFNSLQAWRVQKEEQAAKGDQPFEPDPFPGDSPDSGQLPEDDLPF